MTAMEKQPNLEKIQLQNDIIYGPVQSRRLGSSLGVNLLRTEEKICTMNCCYCQYGWTTRPDKSVNLRKLFPTVQETIVAIRNSLVNHHDPFDYLTFSGNGEPTMHPLFPQIIDLVLELKYHLHSDVKLAVLSNGTTTQEPAVKKALNKVDLPIMKLDAGREETFKKLNHGIPPIKLRDIVDGIKSLGRVTIQTMFVKGKVDNSTEKEVDAWIDLLKEIDPLDVQIYTLDRAPASPEIESVSTERLNEIAEVVRDQTDIPIEIF